MSVAMNIHDILKLIPHRYPFLLVDRVDKFDISPDGPIGSSVEGIKNVTINEPFFQGHFPGHPVFPGVLTIEALAQIAALLVYKFAPWKPEKHAIYLTGLDRVRYRGLVIPGDTLRLKVTISQERSLKLWKCHGVAKVNDKLVAEADIMASLVAKGK